jgi:DNA invertase Pin-like site-specific DNA recombinase
MSSIVILARASTKHQGKDGLGIKAQLHACRSFAERHHLNIVDTFIEVGSGMAIHRPVLSKAMEVCRSSGATLCVSALSRLSRKVSYIASLLDDDIKFYNVEWGMRDVGKFEISIHAAFCEMEASRISIRTKTGLARSTKRLGNPNPEYALRCANTARSRLADEWCAYVFDIITELRTTGVKRHVDLAKYLNIRGIRTRRGSLFSATTVGRAIRRQRTLAMSNPATRSP